MTNQTQTTPTHPHEMFPGMKDPRRALGESLAFCEGYIHQYWCSESHRRQFDARALEVIEALRRRGWRLERVP